MTGYLSSIKLLLLMPTTKQCITLCDVLYTGMYIYDECMLEESVIVWLYCTEIFDGLSLSAIITDTIFCVYGLLPSINTLQQVNYLKGRSMRGNLIFMLYCNNILMLLLYDVVPINQITIENNRLLGNLLTFIISKF